MKPTYSANNNSLARNMEETVKQIFKQFNWNGFLVSQWHPLIEGGNVISSMPSTAWWAPCCWAWRSCRATDAGEVCNVACIWGKRFFLGAGLWLSLRFFPFDVWPLNIVPWCITNDKSNLVTLSAWWVQVMIHQVMLFYLLTYVLHLKSKRVVLPNEISILWVRCGT